MGGHQGVRPELGAGTTRLQPGFQSLAIVSEHRKATGLILATARQGGGTQDTDSNKGFTTGTFTIFFRNAL